MVKKFFINGKEIRQEGEIFIIAEAGVNHCGRLDLALRLVDCAARAGADAIKFQTFRAEQVVTEKAEMANYQKKGTNNQMNQREMLRRLELKEDFYLPIIKRCKERNIIFLSTPHGGEDSVNFLEQLGVVAYKIASGDLTNYLLLERVAKTRKPVILSSGMATFKEVREAVNFLKQKGSHKIAVLHCTSSYPCALKDVNLSAMEKMVVKLNVPLGYSDHTPGNEVAIMAATLGAAVYECHFTLDKKLPGPDHIASVEPDELTEKIKLIRSVKMIMGDGIKKPTKTERKEMILLTRKSIVAAKNLSLGHRITRADLEAKRPGNGISPKIYQRIIGKVLRKAIGSDEQLTWRHLESRNG